MHNDRGRLENCALSLCPELRGLGFRVMTPGDLSAHVVADIDQRQISGLSSATLAAQFGLPPCPAVFVNTHRVRRLAQDDQDARRRMWKITLHELGHLFGDDPPYFRAGSAPAARAAFAVAKTKECHRLPWMRIFLALGERSCRSWLGAFSAAELLEGYTSSDDISERFWQAMRPQIERHLGDIEALKRLPMPASSIDVLADDAGVQPELVTLPMLKRSLPMKQEEPVLECLGYGPVRDILARRQFRLRSPDLYFLSSGAPRLDIPLPA